MSPSRCFQIFREDGIDVSARGVGAEQVEGRSGQSVRVRLQTPAGEQVVEGSDLLAALGRVPNTEELNLPPPGSRRTAGASSR